MADFPNIEPDAEQIGLVANTQIYESPLTRGVQTASLNGSRWMASPTYNNRQGKDARDLRAFIFNQDGAAGRFNYYPFTVDNQGTHAGGGVVDGAGQVGKSLLTKGWDADQPLLFATGDYLTINGEMKMVTADVASDALGGATIPITPALRVSPSDGNAIEVDAPYFPARLETDDQSKLQVSSNLIYNTTLSIVEDF